MEEKKEKKVDGLSLKPEDLARSRQIVLETIGEDQEKRKTPSYPSEKSEERKSTSFIKFPLKTDKSTEVVNRGEIEKKEEKYFVNREQLLEEITDNNSEKRQKAQAALSGERQKKTNFFSGLFKKTNTEAKQSYAPDFKNINLPAGNVFYKRQTIGKKLFIPQKTEDNLGKINRQAAAGRFRSRPVEAKSAFPEKKEKNLFKKFFNLWQLLKKFFSDAAYFIVDSSLFFLNVFLNTIFVFVSLYIIFIFIITAFAIDNAVVRKINIFLPVPAIISNQGIVNFFWYKDEWLKKSADYQARGLTSRDFKNEIIKNIILNKLGEKYGQKRSDYDNDQAFRESLIKSLSFDFEINQVPISRINKIRKMVLAGGNFSEIAEKYGDEQGDLNLTLSKLDSLAYKSAIENIKTGELSKVIIQPEGYYIFNCRGRSQNIINLRYVLVKPITLESYLDSQLKKFRHISLIDKNF